jgi:hypothetical protein
MSLLCNSWRSNRTSLSDAHAVYGLVIETPGTPAENKKVINKATRTISSAHRKWQAAENLVLAIEDKLDILTRWLPVHPEYVAVVAASGERQYKSALDEIECLVVQRLFELTKLNLMSTGETYHRLSLCY